MKEIKECEALTFEQALNLKVGDILHYADGKTCYHYKVNGQVKTWKKDESRIQVPLKRGLKSYGYLTESNLHLFHLGWDCPLTQGRRLTLAEMVLLNLNKTRLACIYGIPMSKFDTAIPQVLFDQLITKDFDPLFQYVYSYHEDSMGQLFPLTVDAVERMGKVFPYMSVPSAKNLE
jgi:hypothetical protein